jgi:hypothetical protein
MKNLIEIIESVKGCQFANIMYITDGGIPQKVLGKGNVITKLIKTNCQINYSYENAVNNRLEKQGDERNFIAQSLPWGEWVKGQENKLIVHKGTMYLRYYDFENSNIQSLWFVNGQIATAEQFQKIMEYVYNKNTITKSNTQIEKGLIEHQVKPKVVKLENIIKLSVNKCEWIKENESKIFAFAQ